MGSYAKIRLRLAATSFMLSVSFLPLGAQSRDTTMRVPATPEWLLILRPDSLLGDSTFQLPHQFVVEGSDTLTLHDRRILTRGTEYKMDYRFGKVVFSQRFLQQLASDSAVAGKDLIVRYRYLPFRFRDRYFKRQLMIVKDSTTQDTLRVATAKASFSLDDIFGPNIQKSGSLVRGFTVGSNRDLSLNSGLQLQLSGKLTQDIDVVAALTDENTPIQPEGTTQTLQEFDKVFVEMRGTHFAATLGDFNLDFGGTEFARLSRKLQGARGFAEFSAGSTGGSVMLSGAVPRGKFATNRFQGIEGVQGPYRLTGRNNERLIIVIAGTERVYINGEVQTRGEMNDYTIDYSTGEVTFTTRRLVTAASRIVVDFEYTDRQYSRSLLGGQASTSLADGKARVQFSFLREADDKDAPIDFAISDSARRVLADAGGDRNKAAVSGVTRVDSNGLYVAVDTVLAGGTAMRFYRYAPGSGARYLVSFSYVGTGLGEYSREQSLVYVWKGPGYGDYLPVRYLPLPQAQTIMDVTLDLAPASDLKIAGEFGRSSFDANRFSALPGVSTGGNAYSVSAAYAPQKVHIAGIDFGAIDVRLRQRFVDGRFVPVDRANEIEFNRKWGLDSLVPGNEQIQEASLRLTPVPVLSLSGGYGRNTRGETSRSVRNEGALTLKAPELPTIDYYLESIRSKEVSTDDASSWLRQKGSAEYTLGQLTTAFRFEAENRRIRSIQTLQSKPGSLRYAVYSPRLRFQGLGRLSLSTEFEWRTDDLFDNGAVVRESRSFTQSYGLRLSEWNSFSSSVDVTLREKKFSQEFKQRGNPDISTILVRNQSRLTPLNRGIETDLFYQVMTERSSLLERIFVRVTQGSGNYRYLGDVNSNGIAEESEFVPARFDGDFIALTIPTDRLVPVIDLKASVRLRMNPRLFLSPGDGVISRVLSVLSTETYARVEEKSKEPDLKQVYLLHFGRYQSDSLTIAGSGLFTQDLFLWEGRPEFSVRLRFSQRTGLNQLSSGVERNYARERSIRLRWQLVREISQQIDYMNKVDRVTASQSSTRARDIGGDLLSIDISYRPAQDIEVGCKIETGKSSDSRPRPEVTSDLNTQSVRLVHAFVGAGQARVEFGREEVIVRGSPETMSYELTGGRVPGKTWLWRTAMDYRVTQFIQATLNYDGRSEGGRSPVHTARAEVRAFF